jgi:predicted ester cyclase
MKQKRDVLPTIPGLAGRSLASCRSISITYKRLADIKAYLGLNHGGSTTSHFKECGEDVDGIVTTNVLQQGVDQYEDSTSSDTSAVPPTHNVHDSLGKLTRLETRLTRHGRLN